MRQELTIEIVAAREAVWAALRRDLDYRGDHVRVLVDSAPAELEILVHAGPGERLTLSYELIPLDQANTAVRAAVSSAGPGYLVKRLLTFGAVDRGYLDALAVGLANLQRHLEGDTEDDDSSG